MTTDTLTSDTLRVPAVRKEYGFTSDAAVYRAVASGHLPPGVYWRVGRALRFSRAALEQFIADGGTATPIGTSAAESAA
jgi:predicted DNA-binding transcriptional regulator AlpA